MPQAVHDEVVASSGGFQCSKSANGADRLTEIDLSSLRPGTNASSAVRYPSALIVAEDTKLGGPDEAGVGSHGSWKDSLALDVEAQSQSPPLLFPAPTDSDPPSPDPFRPSSPLRWRSKADVVARAPQPLHDTPVAGLLIRDPIFSGKVDETPVRGLLTRDPTFSDHTHGRTLFQEKGGPSAAERSPLGTDFCRSAAEEGGNHDDFGEEPIDEFLSSLPACIASNEDNLDYSFALEYKGPPIDHAVPKVKPLGADFRGSAISRSAMAPVLPVDSKSWGLKFSPQTGVAKPVGCSQGAGQISSSKVVDENLRGSILSPCPNIYSDRSDGNGASRHEGVHLPKNKEIPCPQPRAAEGGYKKIPDPVCAVVANDQIPGLHSVQNKASPRVFPAPIDSISQRSSASVSRGSSVAETEAVVYGSTSASASTSVSASVSASEYPSPTAKFPFELTNPEHHGPDNYAQSALTMDTAVGSSRQLSFRGGRSISLPLPVSSHHSKSNSVATDFSQQLVYAPVKEEGPPVKHNRRKGECHWCLRGQRLREKETCLVCSARYCSNCVLTAMGSMPEGRKCTQCIGKPIHETKRQYLGKCSRLLSRLLSSLEIQQILKAETECAANQLQPQEIFVNNQPLTPEGLAELLTCAKPPAKLKPGRYWYDQTSGLWGKQGENPDQIISFGLKVGGPIQKEASNGHTGVLMNDRELGKWELRLLKLAGVHCPVNTHLWVDEEGCYREAGQKEHKGNIWDKASSRLFYRLCSLPIPHVSSKSTRNDREELSGRYLAEYLEPKGIQKLLLLGHEGSGRSTVFKQAKYLFKEGFSPEEVQEYKSLIQSNAYKYISILLEGRERFEDADSESGGETSNASESGSPSSITRREDSRTSYALDPKLKEHGDWFLEIMATGVFDTYFPAATREYAPVVEELWHDPAIQATFKRKDELHMLPDVAGYFLEKVGELSSNEYEPSEDDILAAEGLTQGSGLAQIEFIMEDKSPLSGPYTDAGDSSAPVGRYQLIRVGGVGVSEGKKWLDMFEDVCAVIFCVSLSDYDELWADNNGVLQNKLIQSKELFESILLHPCFRNTLFVLLLNKRDVFEEKICKGIPLSRCEWLSDFQPLKSSNSTPQTVAQQAYHYVVHKFKEVYATINNARGTSGHKLLTFELNARDRSKVNQAFMYIREILKWEENKLSEHWNGEYSYCTDTNSSLSPSLAANHPAFYNFNDGGLYGGAQQGAAYWGRTI